MGDWLRIGTLSGYVYTVTAMLPYAPFTVTLNRPYQGVLDAAAPLYRQDTLGYVSGYQYIVEFDDFTRGDLPALVVNGSRLVAGAGGEEEVVAEVANCDWLARQTVATTSAGKINGTFYLAYAGERTRDLPFDANATQVRCEPY